MKVKTLPKYDVDIVLMYPENDDKKSYCGWVFRCSCNCGECPAKGGEEKVTQKEAVKYWEGL
jgi:hypothetical protein